MAAKPKQSQSKAKSTSSNINGSGRPIAGIKELDEEFFEAVVYFNTSENSVWRNFREKLEDYVGRIEKEQNSTEQFIGVRYIIKTIYLLLKEMNYWTQADVADCILKILSENGLNKIKHLNRELIINLFVGSLEAAKGVPESHFNKYVAEYLLQNWWRVGSEKFHGKEPLIFDPDKEFVSAKWSKPSELYMAMKNRLAAARAGSDPWINGLHDAPDLNTTHLPFHDAAQRALVNFMAAPLGSSQVFTLAGESLSGKTTVLAGAHTALKNEMATREQSVPPLLYLDLAVLPSFEAVVSRIGAFFNANIAKLGTRSVALRADESWSGSTETKLRGIATAARRLESGVIFLVNGAPATIQNGAARSGGPTLECLLHDDRLDRLVEFLTELNASNRVVLAISPEASSSGFTENTELGGRQVDFNLPLLELRELKTMLRSSLIEDHADVVRAAASPFARHHNMSIDELDVLVDDLLGRVPVRAGRVGGRFLMSALALLWLGREQLGQPTDAPAVGNVLSEGRRDDDAALRAAFSPERSVKHILGRIYQRLRDDPHARVALTMLAFGEGGTSVRLLTNLLRYHRHIFADGSAIAGIPTNCSSLDRSALRQEDAKRIFDLVERLRFLVKKRPPRDGSAEGFTPQVPATSINARHPQNSQDQTDETLENVLELNKVLGPILSEVIEEMDPKTAAECHLVLARESRRQGMRSRLDRPGAYGAALEDLTHDFAVLKHLLASTTPSASQGPFVGADPRQDEWQVFTASDRRTSTILRFAAQEILEKDIDLGRQHRVTGMLQADDVVVGLMKRFFHLGRSACPRGKDDENLLDKGIGPLLESVPWVSVVSIVTKLAVAALQRHDFATLWSAVILESRLLTAGASSSDLLRLRLVRLDALILTGQYFRDATIVVDGQAKRGAEEFALGWLEELGCSLPRMPEGWRPHEDRADSDGISHFVETSSKLKPKDRWACGKLLARLGEIAHHTRKGPLSLWYFALANSLVPDSERDAPFPLLSGMSGRRWLAALLSHAGRCRREEDTAGFNWAKARAELVHRHNLRRLGVFAIERAGVVVDEAALERQVRGMSGAGNLALARKVIEDAYDNALEASAPTTVRLEFALERARCAMYLGEFLQQTPRAAEGRDLVSRAGNVAHKLANRINARYTTESPLRLLAETYAVEARCLPGAQTEWSSKQAAIIRASKSILPMEEDVSTLTNTATRDRLERLSWRDEPRLP